MTGERSVTMMQHGTDITVAVIDPQVGKSSLRTYFPSRAVKWLVLRVVSQIANAHSHTVEFTGHEGTHVLSFTYPPRYFTDTAKTS